MPETLVTRTRSRLGKPRTRVGTTGTALIVAAALGGGVAPAGASARTVPIAENVSLQLVKKSGTSFTHRGRATGTYAGSVTSKMTLDSLSIRGTVTIKTTGGSVRLVIRGTARSSGLRSKFDGSATVARGTGRFAKARGTGRFNGVVNRKTWAATINSRGSMTY